MRSNLLRWVNSLITSVLFVASPMSINSPVRRVTIAKLLLSTVILDDGAHLPLLKEQQVSQKRRNLPPQIIGVPFDRSPATQSVTWMEKFGNLAQSLFAFRRSIISMLSSAMLGPDHPMATITLVNARIEIFSIFPFPGKK